MNTIKHHMPSIPKVTMKTTAKAVAIATLGGFAVASANRSLSGIGPVQQQAPVLVEPSGSIRQLQVVNATGFYTGTVNSTFSGIGGINYTIRSTQNFQGLLQVITNIKNVLGETPEPLSEEDKASIISEMGESLLSVFFATGITVSKV